MKNFKLSLTTLDGELIDQISLSIAENNYELEQASYGAYSDIDYVYSKEEINKSVFDMIPDIEQKIQQSIARSLK